MNNHPQAHSGIYVARVVLAALILVAPDHAGNMGAVRERTAPTYGPERPTSGWRRIATCRATALRPCPTATWRKCEPTWIGWKACSAT